MGGGTARNVVKCVATAMYGVAICSTVRLLGRAACTMLGQRYSD
jgi:hypothetical protein